MKTKNINRLIDNIPVIIYNKVNTNYKLVKENNYNEIINKNFIKENKKIKGKFKEYLNIFTNILNEDLKNCNFNNFNNNIKELNILEKYSEYKGFIKYASYYTKDNKIEIYNKKIEQSIFHELLHMASTKQINNKLILSGFSIIDFKSLKKYGVFLNEGYTEYLNSKYFGIANTYKTQIEFLKMIEKIIGGDLMQQMYFNADLKGLINELLKYNNTKKEVLEFILNTDIIHKYRFSLSPLKRLKLKRACIKVNEFLINSYNNKLIKEMKNHKSIITESTKFMNDLISIQIDFKSNYYYIREMNNYHEKEINKKKLTL